MTTKAVTKHPMNFHVRPDMFVALSEFRAKTGMSYNEFFRRIAAKALQEYKEKGAVPTML